MRIFHSAPFLYAPEPSVATIGNFDGMHLGHKALLQQLIERARQAQLKSTVILFEPQPLEFLKSTEPPARLYRLSDKLLWLKQLGIDQVIVLRFDQTISCLPAKKFIEQLLIEQYAVRAVLVGEDFCFGHNRQGNIDLLRIYQAKGLLDIFLVPAVKQNEVQVSSTEIRHQLRLGDFNRVQQLLGRPFVVTGRVMHGAKLGKLINFPTINIALHRLKSPLHGVYAVRVQIDAHTSLPGIANIGTRPTILPQGHWLLEAFLFTEENLDLYTQRVQVEFIAKVRDEQRFDSLDALRTQIEKDVAWVKEKMRE